MVDMSVGEQDSYRLEAGFAQHLGQGRQHTDARIDDDALSVLCSRASTKQLVSNAAAEPDGEHGAERSWVCPSTIHALVTPGGQRARRPSLDWSTIGTSARLRGASGEG